ncbi:MAG: hypothetical protein DI637_01650 [Citromicrobium sp.]|nr:MAG: hypothetical protein DI637_01650 [Citromicrobium sp.]
MTDFEWTNASGSVVTIDTPDNIEAEAKQLASRINRLFQEADNLEGPARARKRAELRSAFARLEQLEIDAARWNRFVELTVREQAMSRANEIRGLAESAGTLRLVVGLHDEFERISARDPDRLDGEPSHFQQRASQLAQTEKAKDLGPTFATAFERLQLDPLFFRPESDEGGWFEWQDGDGLLCRLASPLAIEREVDAIIAELFSMIPKLEAIMPHFQTIENLVAANDLFARLAILQVNLESFATQSTERENEEWECVRKEWMERLK